MLIFQLADACDLGSGFHLRGRTLNGLDALADAGGDLDPIHIGADQTGKLCGGFCYFGNFFVGIVAVLVAKINIVADSIGHLIPCQNDAVRFVRGFLEILDLSLGRGEGLFYLIAHSRRHRLLADRRLCGRAIGSFGGNNAENGHACDNHHGADESNQSNSAFVHICSPLLK